MSKRFGRNQKRAMRERIAEAEEFAAHCLVNAQSQARYAAIARAELDDAKEIASRLSIIFPATRYEVQCEPQSQVQVWDEMSLFDCGNLVGDITEDAAVFKNRSLSSIVADIHQSALNNAIHAEIVFQGEILSYGVERKALALMPRHLLAGRIAKLLTAEFVRQMEKKNIECGRGVKGFENVVYQDHRS